MYKKEQRLHFSQKWITKRENLRAHVLGRDVNICQGKLSRNARIRCGNKRCLFCVNPRRSKNSINDRLTVQERKSIEKFEYDLYHLGSEMNCNEFILG